MSVDLRLCRVARDGQAYSFKEFMKYYGEDKGISFWLASYLPPPAPPSPPSACASTPGTGSGEHAPDAAAGSAGRGATGGGSGGGSGDGEPEANLEMELAEELEAAQKVLVWAIYAQATAEFTVHRSRERVAVAELEMAKAELDLLMARQNVVRASGIVESWRCIPAP